jgi:hypothetical protein
LKYLKVRAIFHYLEEEKKTTKKKREEEEEEEEERRRRKRRIIIIRRKIWTDCNTFSLPCIGSLYVRVIESKNVIPSNKID